jgi:hypothetical protein
VQNLEYRITVELVIRLLYLPPAEVKYSLDSPFMKPPTVCLNGVFIQTKKRSDGPDANAFQASGQHNRPIPNTQSSLPYLRDQAFSVIQGESISTIGPQCSGLNLALQKSEHPKMIFRQQRCPTRENCGHLSACELFRSEGTYKPVNCPRRTAIPSLYRDRDQLFTIDATGCEVPLQFASKWIQFLLSHYRQTRRRCLLAQNFANRGVVVPSHEANPSSRKTTSKEQVYVGVLFRSEHGNILMSENDLDRGLLKKMSIRCK